jgi:hypothetical protein
MQSTTLEQDDQTTVVRRVPLAEQEEQELTRLARDAGESVNFLLKRLVKDGLKREAEQQAHR